MDLKLLKTIKGNKQTNKINLNCSYKFIIFNSLSYLLIYFPQKGIKMYVWMIKDLEGKNER